MLWLALRTAAFIIRHFCNEGYKCIVLDPKLKESSPQIYQSLLDFANANDLKICNDKEDEPKDSLTTDL